MSVQDFITENIVRFSVLYDRMGIDETVSVESDNITASPGGCLIICVLSITKCDKYFQLEAVLEKDQGPCREYDGNGRYELFTCFESKIYLSDKNPLSVTTLPTYHDCERKIIRALEQLLELQ